MNKEQKMRAKQLEAAYIKNPNLLLVHHTAAMRYNRHKNIDPSGCRRREFTFPISLHTKLRLSANQVRYALKKGQDLWLWKSTGRTAANTGSKIYFYFGSPIFSDTYQKHTPITPPNN